MESANGRPHADRMTRSIAAPSEPRRSAPTRWVSSCRACSSSIRSSRTGTAPSWTTRPESWLRLVTITRQPSWPGSSGRTCSASRALSSRTSIARPAIMLRNLAERASSDSTVGDFSAPIEAKR